MAQVIPQREVSEAVLPRLSLEVGLYIALLGLVLVLRLGGLHLTPLGPIEAHDALAALSHVDHRLPQSTYPVNSLGGLANLLTFTLVGTGEVAARLPTALAGILLTFSPLLYRRYLGATATLLCVLGLLVSPVLAAASRTMAGMVWASLLVMLGGYLALRFAQFRQEADAFGASLCAAGALLLTTPYGLLLGLGLFFGLAWAILGGRDSQNDDNNDSALQQLSQTLRAWPRWEALFAVLVGVVIVCTAFFTIPNGLTALAQLPEQFYSGLTTRPPDQPVAYSLLVSLRYDFLFLVFGIIGAVVAWRESTFIERFLTAWLAWAILCCIGYAGGRAELALLITLPAVGLSVSLILRLLQTTYYGFWVVPGWLIPVHSVVMMALLTSLVVSFRSQAEQLYLEARVVDYAKVFNLAASSPDHVRIGTLKPEAEGSSMAFTLPYNEYSNCRLTQEGLDPARLAAVEGQWCEVEHIYNVSFVARPLDGPAKDGLLTIRDGQGNIVYGPEPLGEGQTFLFQAVQPEVPTSELIYTEYRIELTKQEGQVLTDYAQYLVVAVAGDVNNASITERWSEGGLFWEVPTLHAAGTIMLRALGGWPFVLVMMLFLLIPMTFFLVGAFYGARAAWRGVVFGTMLYLAFYSLALNWQVTNVYGGDPAELWYLGQPVPQDYTTLQTVLEEYSQRDNGTDHEIHITAQAPSDGVLAWALRRFPNVRYEEQLDPFTTAPIVLARESDPPPTLGMEYVGQRLELDYHWSLGSLHWTDMGAWLFARRTRFEPQVVNPYRLWVGKDLYDVQTVPQ